MSRVLEHDVCLFVPDFSLHPEDDLLVETARGKDSVLAELRVRPAHFPHRPCVANIACEDLLTLPGWVMRSVWAVLIRLENLVPDLDLLV